MTLDLVPFQRAIGKEFDAEELDLKTPWKWVGTLEGMVECTPVGDQISEVALSLKDQGKEGRV